MSIHRGEIVKEQILLSGMKISHIAAKLGITRATLHNWLREKDLRMEKILRVGSVIEYDFSNEILGINGENKSENILRKKLEEYRAENAELSRKYIKLLEEYNRLLLKIKNGK